MSKSRFDDSMAVSSAWKGAFKRHDYGHGEYVTGHVGTPHGFVIVYCEPGKLLRLDFARNGRLLMRYIRGEAFTEEGIVRLASRFAKEMAGEQ